MLKTVSLAQFGGRCSGDTHMNLEAKIFDDKDSPTGRPVSDLPEGFYAIAIAHARKSRDRFPLLGKVDVTQFNEFSSLDREGLKKEWDMLESLAIGAAERFKWDLLYKAFRKQETFQRLEFLGT